MHLIFVGDKFHVFVGLEQAIASLKMEIIVINIHIVGGNAKMKCQADLGRSVAWLLSTSTMVAVVKHVEQFAMWQHHHIFCDSRITNIEMPRMILHQGKGAGRRWKTIAHPKGIW